MSHNALSRSWLGKVLSSAHFPACIPQECLKSCNLKCHQHTFSSWQWGIMDVIPLKRTTVKSTLLFPSGSRRVLEQTHRSWVAVKSLLCALFLDCFLSVRPAASAPEEFSVFFSKTEKNAARVPLQPPTRQTSPSQTLISVWTRGPVWHSPHTPLLQGMWGFTPCVLTIPCLPPPPAASPAAQIEHLKHDLCFWHIFLCCKGALFPPMPADSQSSGHTAIWVSSASALCVCC